MNKKTKRAKRVSNKTKNRRYRGGATSPPSSSSVDSQNLSSLKPANSEGHFERGRGIFTFLGDKIKGLATGAVGYVADKGLRLAGLQKIDNGETPPVNAETAKIDNQLNAAGEAASGLLTSVKEIAGSAVDAAKGIADTTVDAANKVAAAGVEQVNDVLESPVVENSVSDAAAETADIVEESLDKFNEELSNPKIKEEAKEALNNVADYAEIGVKALDKPLNAAVDKLNDAGTRAASGLGTGIVKVGTDMLAAVPGFGAVIELGKIANDASAAVGNVVEAASDASSTAAELVANTSDNLKDGVKELEEKKREALKISNRTNESINQFNSPLPQGVAVGGNKTRRNLIKGRGKSKRVRFAI
jgi:ABC-type transporter Mla subunit MlaD